MTKDVEIAEPTIKPVPKEKPDRQIKERPNKDDPWTVPYPYDPKTYPAPTPKA